MTGIELRTYGVRSDRSTNCATTTSHVVYLTTNVDNKNLNPFRPEWTRVSRSSTAPSSGCAGLTTATILLFRLNFGPLLNGLVYLLIFKEYLSLGSYMLWMLWIQYFVIGFIFFLVLRLPGRHRIAVHRKPDHHRPAWGVRRFVSHRKMLRSLATSKLLLHSLMHPFDCNQKVTRLKEALKPTLPKKFVVHCFFTYSCNSSS